MTATPDGERQTAQAFSDKWHHSRRLAFDQTLAEGSDIQRWILTRNGLQDLDGLRAWLSGRGRVLDAGCGNGRVTALLRRYAASTTEIVGVDLTAADVAADNLSGEPNLRIETRDLRGDLSGLGRFDLIYCQEVLHHTGDAADAFRNVAELLAPGGEIAIYVYKVKAPLREFTDDYVRDRVADLPYDEAMTAMRQLAGLGRALSELEAEVTVPDVDVLGLPGGTYDVQRLIYDFMAKAFWSPELGDEGSASVNFDWYRPQLATRHRLEEVEDWFAASGLRVIHRHVDASGITVRGVAPVTTPSSEN